MANRLRWRWMLIAWLGCWVAPTLARAQVIQGKLLEQGTDRPIPGATVEVRDPTGRDLGKIATANSAGVFVVRMPNPGRYMLRIRRIGFSPLTTDIVDLTDKDVLLTYRLSPLAVNLATIKTFSRSKVEMGRDAFLRHRNAHKGVFLTRNDFEDKDPLAVANIFRGVDGMNVTANGTIQSTMGWRCVYFMVNRVPVTSDPMQQFKSASEEGLYPTLEQILPTTDDVMAVEVFRQFSEVPAEYRFDAWPQGNARIPGSDTACGIINFWTNAGW